MNSLLDLDTKLTILANNPCACKVCRNAAQLAKQALAEVSPSAAVLLLMPQGTPEFLAAERTFHADELTRLQEAYNYAGRGKCLMAPTPKPDTPPPQTLTPIETLPDPDAFRERIEFYRKRGMATVDARRGAPK